jgi:hypothetical protein
MILSNPCGYSIPRYCIPHEIAIKHH